MNVILPRNTEQTFQKTSTIFVGNCPFDVKEEELVDLFGGFGIQDINVVKRDNRAAAFLRLKDIDTAVRAAAEMDRQVLNGQQLHVVTQDNRRSLKGRNWTPENVKPQQGPDSRGAHSQMPPYRGLASQSKTYQTTDARATCHGNNRVEQATRDFRNSNFPSHRELPTKMPPLILPPCSSANCPPPNSGCRHLLRREDDMPPLILPDGLPCRPRRGQKPDIYQERRCCCHTSQDLVPPIRVQTSFGDGGRQPAVERRTISDLVSPNRVQPSFGDGGRQPAVERRSVSDLVPPNRVRSSFGDGGRQPAVERRTMSVADHHKVKNFERPRHQHSDNSECCLISVSNFPPFTKKMELLDLFEEFEPLGVNMIVSKPAHSDEFTQALIVLPSQEHAEAAIMELDNTWFKQNVILVEEIDDDDNEYDEYEE